MSKRVRKIFNGSMGATIGANLKRERERNELTQQQLADLCGQSRSYITQTENAHVKVPGVDAVYLWASTLGVRMEDLMDVQRVEVTTKGRYRARRE